MFTIQINMSGIQEFKDGSHAIQLFNRARSAIERRDETIESVTITEKRGEETLSEYFIVHTDKDVEVESFLVDNEELSAIANKIRLLMKEE